MTTRLEAAAKAMHDLSDDGQQGVPYTETRRRSRERFAGYALTAADAYDVANNVHRVRLDDATVERAARALNSDLTLQWEKMPEWVREGERRMVRAVLAAAVEAKP
jgi:ABC-type molybdenum transport system ATPase subunit/photorepair protein PhrA